MGIYAIKPRFQKTLIPVRDFCIRARISPTFLNIIGLISSIVIACSIKFYYVWHPLLLFIPLFAFIRTAINALDGMVARERNVSNKAGELSNEFLDRVSDAIIFSSFALLPFIDGYLVAVTTALVLLVSYLGIASKALGGARIYNGIMGKADRMFYLGLFAFFKFFFTNDMNWNYLLYFISFGAIRTIITRFNIIVRVDKKI